MINNVPWLTTIVFFPILAGLMIPILSSDGNKIIRWYTLGICLLEFSLITYVFYCHFQIDSQSLQLLETFSWIDSIHFRWALGIDGLSMGLILLTGFVTTLATLGAWPITRNTRLFYFLMLVMYSGQIGVFVSRDILLFFLMWELELIPVYLLLSLWGGKKRLYSATKFVLYTAGGSIFLLLAALTMSFSGSDVPSFDIQDLIDKSYPVSLEILIYIGFLVAYAVKLPIIPFHTWLPDTHGEAHYSTCMLLAGVLLKIDSIVRVFDVEKFEVLQKFTYPWPVNHTSVSPDNRYVVVVGDSDHGFLADIQSGKVLANLTGHLDYCFASAWHPNGHLFATGNQDTSCRLWDIRNLSSSFAVLKGHIGAIRSLRFSTDGRFLAMAEPADFVHVFDVYQDFQKSQEIDIFGEIAGISFSPDTEALFIGIADRTYGSLLEFNRSHVNTYLDAMI